LAQSNGSRNKKMNGDAPGVEELYVSWMGSVTIVGIRPIEERRDSEFQITSRCT
jgi:hypothetical protein